MAAQSVTRFLTTPSKAASRCNYLEKSCRPLIRWYDRLLWKVGCAPPEHRAIGTLALQRPARTATHCINLRHVHKGPRAAIDIQSRPGVLAAYAAVVRRNQPIDRSLDRRGFFSREEQPGAEANQNGSCHPLRLPGQATAELAPPHQMPPNKHKCCC
jgi:hypothetical protein